MTDDEKAQAALELLAGIRKCPECGRPMEEIPLAVDITGRPATGWSCSHPAEAVYMLDDGTRLVPGPGPNQFTGIRQWDFSWDEETQTWVPDETG